MEFEDSRNALYCDPNAYIQGVKEPERKKVVFQQPYETMPNFYLNNNFKKQDCYYGCEKCKEPPKNENCSCNKKPSFDLKNLMPILGLLGGGKTDFSSLVNLLGNNKNEQSGSILNSILSNKTLLASVAKMFTGKLNLLNKSSKKELQTTDFEISNYTKV